MRRLRAWKYWPWLRELGLVLLIFTAFRLYQQRDLPSGPAPALTGADLTNTPVSLSAYRGAPVLVHFWATWCGVCKAEHHNIAALARDLPVLTVASHSGAAERVAEYARAHGIEERIVVDPDSTLARRFGVSAFPTTFVLDRDGKIRSAEVGYTTEIGLRARMWIARW